MKHMGTIGFLLFASLFFAVGFGITGYAIYNLYASKRAGCWPTTEGKVVRSEIKESSDSEDGTTFKAEVEYQYNVDGTDYTGNRIAFGYSGSSARELPQEIVDRLTGAKTVTVRYNPADASNAVLCHGICRSTVAALIFGMTWTLFTTGFIAFMFLSSKSDYGILDTLITTR